MRKKYCIITMRARDLVSNPVYVVYSIYALTKKIAHQWSLHYNFSPYPMPGNVNVLLSPAQLAALIVAV